MWDWIVIIGVALVYFASGWLFIKDLGWKWYLTLIAWIFWLPLMLIMVIIIKIAAGKGGGGWI
jgi:hypothetical protein